MKIAVRTTAITCKNIIRDMMDLNRITSFVLPDQIAHTPDRMDLYPGAPSGQLLAEPMDVDFHGIRSDIPGDPEDLIFHHLFWHDVTLAPHQQFQDCRLA